MKTAELVRNHALTLAACISALTLCSGVALACSCAETLSPDVALEAAAAVFTGLLELQSVDSTWVDPSNHDDEDCRMTFELPGKSLALCRLGTVTYRFRVIDAWKGVTERVVKVRSDSQSSACGFPFQFGELYLVYARRDRNGIFETTLCDRTKRLYDASSEISGLGKPLVSFASRSKNR